jgi:Bacterial low temperature requirement A protein (LtrA)
MGGRNPHEAHRVATPLELLFDLTFATSFSLAPSQLAGALAAGRFTALLGFSFASFAICWAWTNFSWFSSAYDTDDWKLQVLNATRDAGLRVFYAVHHRYRPGDYGDLEVHRACAEGRVAAQELRVRDMGR